MLELSGKVELLPFIWPAVRCTSKMIEATDPYAVTKSGLRSIFGNRKTIDGSFSAAAGGLICQVPGSVGEMIAEVLAEELRRRGAKPSLELANDRSCVSVWFDISSRDRLAYYKLWLTIEEKSDVWRTYSLVYLRNPDATVVDNLNSIDEALAMLAKQCGFNESQR